VQYIDDFPADFSAFQEEKRFRFVVAFSAVPEQGSLVPSAPEVKSTQSAIVNQLRVGQQLALATVISSSFEEDVVPFVAIMEVRDTVGVTVSLGWQTGTMRPQDQMEVGMSWIPPNIGEYEVRTFLVSDLLVLSDVVFSEVTVS
jgi:hypothetical protein